MSKKRGLGRLRYRGPGFIPGVPARDLTEEEVKIYGEEILLKARSPHTGNPLYERMPVEVEASETGLQDDESDVNSGGE